MNTIESIGAFYRGSIVCKIEEINDKLDPISVLATLALLKYKESLTLLGFHGYQLITQPPTPIQGVWRFLQRESREDLSFIPVIIRKAAEWFQPRNAENEHYRKLFVAARQGLETFSETYRKKRSEVVVDAITGWVELIDRCTADEETAPTYPRLDENDENQDSTAAAVMDLWNRLEIREVNNLLDQMQEKQGDFPVDEEARCQNEIMRLELLLYQKGRQLAAIYEE